MAEITAASASGAAPVAVKASISKKSIIAKRPVPPAEHPLYREMIASAIGTLKERRGSSRQAIHKYILAHYKVGSEVSRINGWIKTALRAGVKNGDLRQVKGSGASGSFRLVGKLPTPKPSTAKKPKTAATKKPVMKKLKIAGKKKTGTMGKKTADARRSKSVNKARKSPSKAAAKKTTKVKVHGKSPAKKTSKVKVHGKSLAKKVAKKTAAKPKKVTVKKSPAKKASSKGKVSRK